MQNAIEIEKLVKIYKAEQKIALAELDFNIPQGSIFGLLGPNGAGKTTLINILAGTLTKTSGKVKIMGYDIDEAPKIAKTQIGIAPQEIIIDSFFPLFQALEFTAGYYGIKPKARKTTEILENLGLLNKKNVLPRQLSGGMKRRFIIAKAMVHSPKILVLDEPTAGVDIELREQLWAYIRKLNNNGTTIIITTHYLAEAQELCNQIAFINHGKIIKQDLKENLLNTLGSRYIDVEFSKSLENHDLGSMIGVKFEKLNDYKIRFQFNYVDDHYSFNNLLNNIRAIGMEIKNMQTSQADLETVFRKLIG